MYSDSVRSFGWSPAWDYKKKKSPRSDELAILELGDSLFPVEGGRAEGKYFTCGFDAPIGVHLFYKEWANRKGIDWEPYWKGQGYQLVTSLSEKDNIVFHLAFIFRLAILKTSWRNSLMPSRRMCRANEFFFEFERR